MKCPETFQYRRQYFIMLCWHTDSSKKLERKFTKSSTVWENISMIRIFWVNWPTCCVRITLQLFLHDILHFLYSVILLWRFAVCKDYFFRIAIKKSKQNLANLGNFPILYPWKYQKAEGFLVFSGGIMSEHCPHLV